MKTPIELTLAYLEAKWPNSEKFTALVIHDAMPAAKAHYNELHKPQLEEAYTKVYLKHGYTKEEWDDVLVRARSVLFIGTDKESACNNEIAQACRKIGIINVEYFQLSYTTSVLNQLTCQRKKPKIGRTKEVGIGKVWMYFTLKPGVKYVHIKGKGFFAVGEDIK